MGNEIQYKLAGKFLFFIDGGHKMSSNNEKLGNSSVLLSWFDENSFYGNRFLVTARSTDFKIHPTLGRPLQMAL